MPSETAAPTPGGFRAPPAARRRVRIRMSSSEPTLGARAWALRAGRRTGLKPGGTMPVRGPHWLEATPYATMPATASAMPNACRLDTRSPRNAQPPSSTSTVLLCPSTCPRKEFKQYSNPYRNVIVSGGRPQGTGCKAAQGHQAAPAPTRLAAAQHRRACSLAIFQPSQEVRPQEVRPGKAQCLSVSLQATPVGRTMCMCLPGRPALSCYAPVLAHAHNTSVTAA